MPKLLQDFFLQSAKRWPANVAVEVPPREGCPVRITVTYAELDDWSDRIARALAPHVTENNIVSVLLDRSSAALYATQLGILKSGAAYSCLDPSLPDDRLMTILDDVRPAAFIADLSGLKLTRRKDFPIIPAIDLASISQMAKSAHVDGIRNESSTAPTWLKPESLAYLIHTSGTTGRPKGVMIEHRSIINLIESDIEEFRLQPTDRIAQGSSPAYDSSVEETWMAFAAGSTVVVLDAETSRSGPDLIGWLKRETIHVFCPPPTLLRATGCEEPDRELPDLKLLYVGGEPLTQDLALKWSKGRKLVNGYGPTECTVTCIRGAVDGAGPVSIGKPVSGTSGWVLNDRLEEIKDGSEGELCIGGIGLARGYLGRPDLTNEKFVDHPALGRIYRTGDLARKNSEGHFLHLGRLDAQAKIRGHRIELEEIEAAIGACAGVRSAACKIVTSTQHHYLAAFIIAEDNHFPPDVETVKSSLRKKLPDHMIPARVGFLDEFPTTAGGKLDRRNLPEPSQLANDSAIVPGAPRTEREALLVDAIRETLKLTNAPGLHADFFNDLGGDSLTAAELVTRLRKNASISWIAVRDVYDSRTAAGLAALKPETSETGAPQHVTQQFERKAPAGIMGLQGLWMLMELILGSVVSYFAAFKLFPELLARMGWIWMLILAPLLAVFALGLYAAVTVSAAVSLKRILIGHYQQRRICAWSADYLLHWIVQRSVRRIPWWLFEGTEFAHMVLRTLGATIGERVHIHRGVDLLRGGWDLLVIEDDVSVGQEASLGLVEFASGEIIFSSIRLEKGSTLEIHANMSGQSSLGAGACLGPRAWLQAGIKVPAGERWEGIPAKPVGIDGKPPVIPDGATNWSPELAGTLLVISKLALLGFLAIPIEALSVLAIQLSHTSGEGIRAWLSHPSVTGFLLGTGAMTLIVGTPLTLLLQAASCRLLGRISPGVKSRWSPDFIRIWLKTGLMDSGSQWLYGTMFWPFWLRLAGMKVGRGCEISSLYDTIPENVVIGDKTFCADGIYLGSGRVQSGTISIQPAILGRKDFLGNGAIVPGGVKLPDDVLLGICTVADATRMRPDTGWFGHPPFELPRREIIEFDPAFTENPSRVRILVRLWWELLRFALPAIPALIIPFWYAFVSRSSELLPTWILLLVALPLLNLGSNLVATFAIIGIKWALIGRARPGVHPLWSSWASRWDFVCLAWNLYMRPAVGSLDGTPGLVLLLRIMGVRIGKGVLLGSGFAEDLPDPDMLVFEDNTTIDCLFQAHTFEDRVLKMNYIKVGKGATLGKNAVVLYGSEIGEYSIVGPNSVVMKNEHLLPRRFHVGFPTRPTGVL